MIDTTTLASLKRTIEVGSILTMLSHSWFPSGNLIGVVRKVERKQSNAIQFSGCSWLYWPSASDYQQTADGFSLRLSPDDPTQLITYRVG